MKKLVIIYGISLAALTGLLNFLEYRYFVRELSIEVYLTVVGILFTGLGIWIGVKIVQKRNIPAPPVVEGISALQPSENQFGHKTIQPESGLSNRELEVLQLMATGMSNQEIADKLFVSLSTIKTHSSNLYSKLDVKRRTQAITLGREMGIIE